MKSIETETNCEIVLIEFIFSPAKYSKSISFL